MFIVLPNPFCEWHLQNLVKRAGAVQPSIFLLKSLMYFLALCRKWRFLETFYWHDPDFVVIYPNNLIFTYFYLFAQYLRGWATPLFDFSSRHITDWQDLPKKRRHDRSVLWWLFCCRSSLALWKPHDRLHGIPGDDPVRVSRKTPPEGGRKSMQGERQTIVTMTRHFVKSRWIWQVLILILTTTNQVVKMTTWFSHGTFGS